MNYEHWISYRYLKASKGRFLTFLNVISIAGVAIGVAALIVVTAVMTGFGNNLREKIIGTTPHVMIEKEIGIRDYTALQQELGAIKGVTASSAYVQGNIFLEAAGQASGLMVRGVNPDDERRVTKVEEYLTKGRLQDLKGDAVFIGRELARYYGLSIGDPITLIAPGSGLAGQGWRYTLTVKGIFTSGMSDFDMNLIFTHLSKAQEIFGLPTDMVSGIGVRVNDPYDASEIQDAIQSKLGFGFLVRSWIDINRNLFEALFLEKWGLFIILTLMVIVASFNIISTLVVTVSSKIHDIGILQAIGVPRSSIRRIFTRQGIYIGSMGIFWGLLAGFGLCYILKTYIKVPAEIYSIDRVPVDVQILDVVAIVAAAMVISFIATIYPAGKAAQLQPVEALRYE